MSLLDNQSNIQQETADYFDVEKLHKRIEELEKLVEDNRQNAKAWYKKWNEVCNRNSELLAQNERLHDKIDAFEEVFKGQIDGWYVMKKGPDNIQPLYMPFVKPEYDLRGTDSLPDYKIDI